MIEQTIEHYNVVLPTAEEVKEMLVNRDYQWLLKRQLELIVEAIDKGNTSCCLADNYGRGYWMKDPIKKKFRENVKEQGYRIVTSKDNREWLCWD